jgi:acyl-CoA thioesterase FadM
MWNFEILNAAGEVAAFGSMTNVRVDREGRPQIISDEERAALI